jgi:hypothetical protein
MSFAELTRERAIIFVGRRREPREYFKSEEVIAESERALELRRVRVSGRDEGWHARFDERAQHTANRP